LGERRCGQGRFRGECVGLPDLVADLASMDRDVRRRLDTDPHAIPTDPQHVHLDAVTDHDGLAPLSGHDEHGPVTFPERAS
jgi:hypothetical protein